MSMIIEVVKDLARLRLQASSPFESCRRREVRSVASVWRSWYRVHRHCEPPNRQTAYAKMILRPYQEEAIRCVRDEVVRQRSLLGAIPGDIHSVSMNPSHGALSNPNLVAILLVIATGGGKTFTAGKIILNAVAKGKRCIFLAHRTELIEQCSKTLHRLGIEHGIIKGKGKLSKKMKGKRDRDMLVQVASIQTLIKRKHWDADLVVIDEAHRSYAKTYRKILERYDSKTVVLGLTATPYRADGKPLGDIYNGMVETIQTQELVDDGFLMEPVVYGAANGPSVKSMSVGSKGDYTPKSAAKAMEPTVLHGELLTNWAKICGGQLGAETVFFKDESGREHVAETKCDACTVIFAPNVKMSKQIIEQFKAAGVKAAHVDGNMDDVERARILSSLESGDLSVVSNVNILCLDSETEILTRGGWRNIDNFSKDDLVANWWPDQSITFSKPLDIFRRKRGEDESMVYVDGKYVNMRVTQDHRMLFKRSSSDQGYTQYGVARACDLVGQRMFYPTNGNAIPRDINVDQEFDIDEKKRSRLIVARSYHLRKKHGFTYEESIKEATRRVDYKYSKRVKNPDELTLDECWFIGFWLGDGTATKLKRGGIEYILSQSHRYNIIIDKIHEVCDRIGFDYVYRDRSAPKSKHLQRRFSFPRGTGSGCQERNGVYSIEKYLNKDFADELWGLSREQLWSLLEGFWYADGHHGNGDPPGESLRISNTNYGLLSQIQALCVCRGIYASIRCNFDNGKLSTKSMNSISVRLNKTEHQLVRDRLEFDSEWKDEMVWCCNVESTFIITRRNGKVAVMGNCEGWDLPRLECVIGARPTRSKSLYKQMGGRLMRPDDDCRIKVLLDHANWTRTHGFLIEPTDHSLTKAEKRLRKNKISEKDVPFKECPECMAILPLSVRECTECGYIWPKKEIIFSDENLVELNGKNVQRAEVVPLDERQATFEKLATQCVERQRKPNWARVMYSNIYGEWPTMKTGILMPRFFLSYEKELNKKHKKQLVAQAASEAVGS